MLTLQKHLGNVQRNLWYVARLPALPLYVTKGQSPARGFSPAVAMSVLLFPHQTAWTAWLDANHATSTGVWLRLAKKGSSIQSVSYGEAL
jgi:hypothetical protein